MKKFKFTISKLVFTMVFACCALASQPLYSQGISFDDNIDDSSPPAAPIDGLLGLGIAAGAWYGIKKIKGNKA